MSTITLSRRELNLAASREKSAPSKAGTNWVGPAAFILMHIACLAVFFTGAGVLALSLCGACYLLQMVGITIGYHRYFSHRSFKTSRAFQFVLACLGCSASQKRTAVVDGAPPPPPSHLGHAGRPALAHRPQLLVVAHRLGPVRGLRWGGRAGGARLEPLPRTPLARPLSLGASHRAGCAVPGHRRLEWAGLGLRRQQCAVAPRDLHGELALSPLGPPALCDHRTPAGITCSWR